MPKRSNKFQRKVLTLASETANGSQVDESTLLTDLLTGGSREVDITVEGALAGHKIRIGIESRAVRRPADVIWVEQMKAKHDRLPTNLLVLVSRSGFTAEARRVAALAKIITWTFEEMEQAVRSSGVHNDVGVLSSAANNRLVPCEYGFVPVSGLVEAYMTILTPMLQDRGLSDRSILGVLMCKEESSIAQSDLEVDWTIFVDAAWLKWMLEGSQSGYGLSADVPHEKIHGQVSAWPDTFFEFLQAIVMTNTTFGWQRHANGYLVLSQMR